MSFFVNFLDNLDKQAASALKNPDGSPAPALSASVPSLPQQSTKDFFDDELLATLPTSYSTQTLPSSSHSRTPPPKDQAGDSEDLAALFNFLNEVSTDSTPARTATTSPLAVSSPSPIVLPSSSTSSSSSSPPPSDTPSPLSTSPSSSSPSPSSTSPSKPENESSSSDPQQQQQQTDASSDSGSRMKVKLLESKVHSLQSEIATLTGHVRHFSAALDKAKDELRRQKQQLDERDREVRQLRESESQFDGVLREKDQKIADVEVELEEARQDSLAEREEAQRWRSKSDGLADEKGAVEQQVQRLSSELQALQTQHQEGVQSLESRLSDINDALVAAQRAVQQRDQALAAAEEAKEAVGRQLEAAQTELKDYQHRATAVLETKERRIEQLEQQWQQAANGGGGEGNGDGTTTKTMMDARVDALTQELAFVRSEKEGLSTAVRAAESAAEEAQRQAKADRVLHASELATVQERAAAAEKEGQQLQLQVAQRGAEILDMRSGYEQETQRLRQQIESQALEQQVLQRQLKAKSLSASSAELEARNQQLAELLVRQQRQMEALRTQNATLQVQLEQAAPGASSSVPTVPDAGLDALGDLILMGSSSDTVHSLPLRRRPTTTTQAQPKLRSLASLAPELSERSDTVSQAILKTADRIDAISSFTISILQEYPISRALLFIYLVFLHLWSVFLLQHMLQPHQLPE